MDTLPYSFRHYTDENGLPQNSVKGMALDRNGFLWMATESGLVRFDGERFRNFNKNELGTGTSRMTYIYPEGDSSTLLAGTENNEVVRINNGAAYIRERTDTANDAYRFIAPNDSVELDVYPITVLPNLFERHVGTHYFRIPSRNSAHFLIGPDSIAYMERHQRKIYSFRYKYANPWRFFTIKGRLYYLDEHGQFTVFNRQTPVKVALTGDIVHDPAFPLFRERMRLYWSFVSEETFLYFNSTCYQLILQPDGSLHTRLVLLDFDFDEHSVVCVQYDSLQSRIFLGSMTKGLYVATRQQFRALNSSLPGIRGVYYALASLGNNQVITPQGVIFDPSGPVGVAPAILELNTVMDPYSITTDKWGYIWMKSWSVLAKFSADGKTLLWKWQAPCHINGIYISKDDRLWVGTRYCGVYSFATADPSPVPVRFSKLRDVICMQQETPDVLWIGTRKGLYRQHLPSRRIDTMPYFKDKYVRSLHIPQPNQVWVTTYDDGFFLYQDTTLTHFPLDRDKYLATAHCIIPDDKGYFWITTNKGLFQARRRDLLAYARKEQSYVFYLYYRRDKGFNTNEFNGGCQPCAVKLFNGQLMLPSLNGIVTFTPGALNPEVPDKDLFIDQATLNAVPIPYSDTLLLPHKFQQLTLHISSPYFGDPNNLYISYALTQPGNDTLWFPVNSDRTLSFSSLPSGTYQLLVRKVNGFGKNNYTDKVVTLVIQRAYYESGWFLLLIALAAVVTVWIYIRLRTRKIKQQNIMLEMRVTQRTAELRAAMASLTYSEKKLRRQTRTQERLIAAITHDIKTPLRYVMMMAGNLWQEQEAREEEPRMVKTSKAIHDASHRMYYLIDNLIQYIKSHLKNGHVEKEVVDLYDLLEGKVDIFSSIAQDRSTTIVNEVPADQDVYTNRQLLGVVVHNLLDNAVKYTRGGVIRLSTCNHDSKTCIIIEDTGYGLPPALEAWINSYVPMQQEEVQQLPSHNGMGLLIVLELLELVNGRLVAESVVGKGTRMKIILE